MDGFIAWLKSVLWIVSSQIWGLISKLSSEVSYGLCMASLWPGHGWFCGLAMA